MGLVTVIAAQWLYGGVVLFLAAGVFLLVSSYYEAVLKEGGPDRDRVLDRLARGGDPRAFYIDQMSGLLDRVDGLLGDAGQGQRWVQRLFGLGETWPCWTGRSFDVCARIAVIYPFASLVATWLVVGDAGPIGDLIGLRAQPDPWGRLALGAALGISIFSGFRFVQTSGWRSFFWFVILIYSAAVAVAVAVAGAVTVAVAVTSAVAGISDWAANRRRLGAFWAVYWPIALGGACLGLWLGGRLGASAPSTSLVVMIGVMPLVNLPFDWISIGVPAPCCAGAARTEAHGRGGRPPCSACWIS